jgi:hypothetical protein
MHIDIPGSLQTYFLSNPIGIVGRVQGKLTDDASEGNAYASLVDLNLLLL